jgi:hypothetical protein
MGNAVLTLRGLSLPYVLTMRLLPLRMLLVSILGLAQYAESMATEALEVKLESLSDRVRVEIGGHLFTEYIFKGSNRPYLYPVLMPDGVSLVRDYPMKTSPGEETDHRWHRSLWFAHPVNDMDFWNGSSSGLKIPNGTIVHDGILEAAGGGVGLIRSRERWLSHKEDLVCTTETVIRLRGTSEWRMIDYEVTFQAGPEKPLVMLDTKEGTMAIRLAQWMTLPHSYQGRNVPGEGHYVTSTGLRDAAVWGKRAAWCDAHAPYQGRTYGVAIFDHPKNPRHPTWWMARDYGLFAANPFGQHDFENLSDVHAGDYTIPAGGSLTLRYRFLFHYGDEQAAKIAGRYGEYIADN